MANSNSPTLIQQWRRQEDIQLVCPNTELVDAWSSDGDSVSSTSTSSDELSATVSDEDGNADVCSSNKPRGPSGHNSKLLRRAQLYTSEEAIEQAVDRWKSYIRLCRQTLTALRQQMVDSYVPYAVEIRKGTHTTNTGNAQLGGDKDQSQSLAVLRRNRERRALRNFGRHSVKIANQRHLACVSKFATVSNRLATWRKPTAGQQCRYRDPTTTTWEKHCTNLCVPNFSVCASHLVQISPAPGNPSSTVATQKPDDITCEDADVTLRPNTSPPGTTTTSVDILSTATSSHEQAGETGLCLLPSSSVHLPPNVHVAATQYLLRCCGGGANNSCREPIVNWSSSSRCPRHTYAEHVGATSVPPVPLVDAAEEKQPTTT